MKPLVREQQQQQLGNSFWLDVLSFAHRSISRQSTNRWQENKSRYWFIDEELGPLPITHERKKDHGANYKDGSRSRKWIGKKKMVSKQQTTVDNDGFSIDETPTRSLWCSTEAATECLQLVSSAKVVLARLTTPWFLGQRIILFS